MKEQSFTDLEYANRSKKTKKDVFLQKMEEIVPWEQWTEKIAPYYYKRKSGRKPIGIETMLRMYLMQEWYGLSADGIEDEIYDSFAMKHFLNVDFFRERVPDATTLMRFRRMLKKNGLDAELETELKALLKAKNYRLKKGSVEDALAVKIGGKGKRKK